MQPIAFHRVLVATVAGAALFLGAGAAQAQSSNSGAAVAANGSDRMSIRDVYTHLEKQGFSDFRKIECENLCRRFEIEARSANGRRVELEVDSRTGAILKQERG